MDTNLDDSMNLESTIGVDFDQAVESSVISQSNIILDEGDGDNIPMEFEHIEEQGTLMDTGNEEIIISDFIGDQMPIQEFSVQDDQMTGNETFESQNDELGSGHDIKKSPFANVVISVSSSGDMLEDSTSKKPKFVQVNTLRAKNETVLLPKSVAPKQVAIAPKPIKLGLGAGPVWEPFAKKATAPVQQFTFPPKTLKTISVPPKPVSLVKKVTIGGNISSSKATVLNQLGKQIVMVPAGGAQKLKLVAAGGGTVRLLNNTETGQAQLITTDSSGQTTKPIIAKVVLQGQSTKADSSSQVITKLVPTTSGAGTQQTLKYVTMQQKTVPISISSSQVLLGSPTSQGLRFTKKQQVIVKSPKAKISASLCQPGATPKKVVLSANPGQNIVLKGTSAPKTGHISKVISGGQKTQLHQINVPGKGVQFIRVVTNTNSLQGPKVAPKQPTSTTAPKTFFLTDTKGNVIQMSTDKLVSGQPPPLITASGANLNKITSKPQQKLVRIAPVTSKTGQAIMQARPGKSLLAPLSPQPALPRERRKSNSLEEQPQGNRHGNDMPSLGMEDESEYEQHDHVKNNGAEEIDSKAALMDLIAKTLTDETQPHNMNEVEIEYEKPQHEQRHNESGASGTDEHPLIVIPYCKQELIHPDNIKHEPQQQQQQTGNMLSVEVDYNQCDPPMSPLQYAPSESELVPSELSVRPRKACNCTKSQCLKLYCDCFASGEFCNGCNCNNCHNNLQNEELRQKAIRGCLDRNPNAFRPKIGKAKLGGPEIIRRHNKGCNCKRSGCLKNYCECYEAKIACTGICKCVGCRNVEDTLERARHSAPPPPLSHAAAHAPAAHAKQPCSFMTQEVIEAVCQCLVAAAAECQDSGEAVRDVLEEFARCLHDIISAAHHAPDSRSQPRPMLSQTES